MDKTLVCRDCGAEFVFTEREQEFYASKGFTNEPSRCAPCRAARKASRDGGMGGGGYAGDRGPREMYPAVCARCGKDTQVPFQPRTEKPVYCSDCFALERGSSSGGGGGGGYRRGGGSSGGGRNRW